MQPKRHRVTIVFADIPVEFEDELDSSSISWFSAPNMMICL